MTDNLSAILYKTNDMRLEQRPVPKVRGYSCCGNVQPAPGQLLIRVSTVGICGSDVHYLKAGAIGSFIVK